MHRIHGFDSAGTRLAALAGVIALAAAGPLLAQNTASGGTSSTRPGAALITGTFTGEYVNGSPVYRLPPITVTANRKAELAKLAREDRLASAAAKSVVRNKTLQPAQVATVSDPPVK